MDAIDLLGMTAGGLTTASFFPQLLKTWKTKSAADISLGMFVLFSSGVFLWLLYGIAIGAYPVIVANAITLALALLILVLKLHYQRRR